MGSIIVDCKNYEPQTRLDKVCLEVFERTLQKAKEQENHERDGWRIKGFYITDMSGIPENFGEMMFGPPHCRQIIRCKNGKLELRLYLDNHVLKNNGGTDIKSQNGSYHTRLMFSFAYSDPPSSDLKDFSVIEFSPQKAQYIREPADVALIDEQRVRHWLYDSVSAILDIELGMSAD